MALILIAFLPALMQAQTAEPQLLGACSTDDLKKEPYAEWYTKNYTDYTPDKTVVAELKDIEWSAYSISIFFGTWCGDSQREVPRLVKVLDAIGFPPSALSLIAVGSADSLYRQSPGHEEKGKHVYRVPSFIIYENGNEINRIVEYPATSLERDLLSIADHGEYMPNYPAYLYLAYWLDEGILTDDNVSHKGLANQIRHLTQSASELNSFGYLLLRHDSLNLKAVSKVYQLNCDLFPNVWWTYTKLAEALSQGGDHEQAAEILQEGLEKIKDPANAKHLQELYDTIQSKL
jgi:thiol-disulfide isomerase/thioredoxin